MTIDTIDTTQAQANNLNPLKTRDQAREDYIQAMQVLSAALVHATAISCYAYGPMKGPLNTMKDIKPMIQSEPFKQQLNDLIHTLNEEYAPFKGFGA